VGSSPAGPFYNWSMSKKIHAHIAILVKYLKMKIKQKDWHGVADAAMDIRELEAKLKAKKK
jgi:hypothetical protein